MSKISFLFRELVTITDTLLNGQNSITSSGIPLVLITWNVLPQTHAIICFRTVCGHFKMLRTYIGFGRVAHNALWLPHDDHEAK